MGRKTTANTPKSAELSRPKTESATTKSLTNLRGCIQHCTISKSTRKEPCIKTKSYNFLKPQINLTPQQRQQRSPLDRKPPDWMYETNPIHKELVEQFETPDLLRHHQPKHILTNAPNDHKDHND